MYHYSSTILMKKIVTGMLLFASTTVFGQINSPWTQYYQVPYLQNPSLSGIENDTDIKLGFKRQWTSFDGAPKNYFLGINHALGERNAENISDNKMPQRKMGISGYIAGSDYNGMSDLQTGVAYAVHIPVTEQYYLSFGIATSYGRTRVSMDQYVRDKQDAMYLSLMKAGGTLSYFNLDAGATLYADQFYVSYAAMHLVHSRVGDDLPGKNESSIRHTVMLGYRYTVNEDWELQPGMLLRMEGGVKNLYAINVKARYGTSLWGGIGVSVNESLSLLAGYQVTDKLSISYSYDFNIGTLHTASPGSHEFILGIRPFWNG